MVDMVPFRARARTIDHLGREQIADCPTAISELWKNAYDAYATEVALHIYDGVVPTAAIVDDGHGMTHKEFVDKWFVVGTEAKIDDESPAEVDTNGLKVRSKQGQKGIGRLSSGFLGPLLLVVSKKKNSLFAAALVDWRTFQNPYLLLQDIKIPVAEFGEKQEIFGLLPGMVEGLRSNIEGDGLDVERDERVCDAWVKLEKLAEKGNYSNPRHAMESTYNSIAFEERHFSQWPVWSGKKEHGTILLIADIIFDLAAHLTSAVGKEDMGNAGVAVDRTFQTLSSFTDPYSLDENFCEFWKLSDFKYAMYAWDGVVCRSIISDNREFDQHDLSHLEHVVEGVVDDAGVFKGKVKAFGKWLDGEIVIDPVERIAGNRASRVGPFHIRLGTFQQNPSSSSHPPHVHQGLLEQAAIYSGVMIYRNGLRVMPYGREDNDFFEIENRRSKHAGRYFWSNRRTFGRVAIARELNPNLKDKAGREGFIDNKASKAFRSIVANILIKTAYDYFGTDSNFQKQYLPEIKAARAREKAEEERNRQRASLRKRFRSNLKKYSTELLDIARALEVALVQIKEESLDTEIQILEKRRQALELKNSLRQLSLGEAPRNLGSLEKDYADFRFGQRRANEMLEVVERSLNVKLEAIKPKAPREIIYSEINSHAAFLQARLRKWNKEARELLAAEMTKINALYEERSKYYHGVVSPLLDAVENGEIELRAAFARLMSERERIDVENTEIFEPYVSALQSLQENINLGLIVTAGVEMVDEMREELSRLHSLAQLGITVEIIGHEIEGLEVTVSEGMNALPSVVKSTSTYANMKVAHEALSERLKFLSPLKLSGPKYKANITGADILAYVTKFLSGLLDANGIALLASEKFRKFSIYEQPSRIYPVFVNLINNAIYWARQSSNSEGKIFLDVVQHKVIVGDDGPGVHPTDISKLFSLFFTRKIRGGRGIGLYLCRANLAAGGHTISYALDDDYKVSPGANFVIDFQGGKYE